MGRRKLSVQTRAANTTCFAYSTQGGRPFCTILNELYCQNKNGCHFYKRKGEENMTLVKKSTIDAAVFEKKMIALIKLVKTMEMPDNTKNILLGELRNIHNGCLEWGEPVISEDFKILKELLVE